MLSGSPGDEVVEPDDLVPVRAGSGRERCEPRNPAPPVIEHSHRPVSAADRAIREAELLHLARIVEIAAVEDDRTRQRALDAREVRVPELVPLGDDDERVGALERVVVRRRVGRSGRPRRRRASCMRHRIVRDDGRAALEQLVDQRERRRLAHVVGLRLEREPPDRDACARAASSPNALLELLEQHVLLPLVRLLDRVAARDIARRARCAVRSSACTSFGKHEPP